MGLDLLVRDGNGAEVYGEKIASYSGFHEFRVAWARFLGFELNRMQGFGGTLPWHSQPLRAFFNHSDCDGKLSGLQAREILKAARRDAPKLPEFDWQFRVLIAACKKAVKHRTHIIFC